MNYIFEYCAQAKNIEIIFIISHESAPVIKSIICEILNLIYR